MKKLLHFLVLAVQILLGGLFLFSAYFKFANGPEVQEGFRKISEVFLVGPWFQYFTAVWELLVGVFILFPKTWHLGSIMGLIVMLGATVVNLSAAGMVSALFFTVVLSFVFLGVGLYRAGGWSNFFNLKKTLF